MIDKITKRNGTIADFDKSKITFAILRAAIAVGGRDKNTASKVTEDVIRLLLKREYADSYPTVEEVGDLVEKCLIERGHAKTAKAYILYRYEHTLKRAGRESLAYSSENIPYKKLWQALSWAIDNGCAFISQIAESLDSGKIKELVRLSEEFYASEIDLAASDILQHIDEARLLIIAGPSASGKTTTTIKIGNALREKGYALRAINIDNYFFNLSEHPRDALGDYDFETPQALDLALVNRHLKLLLDGKSVDIPRYDFKLGKRDGISGTLALGERDIVLIDSLHGMYGAMTEGIEENRKYKIYVETLSQLKDSDKNYIRWSDIRMMRRMVRDMQFRNYNAAQTISHWRYVRRSELRHIVPKLKEARVIVNTFLPYEILLLKARLSGVFEKFAADFAGNPEYEDALERTERVKKLLDEIPEWNDEEEIPGDSLVREFIGGSLYQY
jgi:uridine kinase